MVRLQSQRCYSLIWNIWGEDWAYLSSGQLIVNINDVENIELEPHESYSRVIENSYIPKYNGKCEESVYYEIDKYILKRICDAKSVDFQIQGNGGADVYEVNANNFIKYAQVFYNEFYDEDAYKEVFNENLDFLHPVVEDDDEEEGDGDSKDAGAGNGCMVTLLMVCGALSSFAFCLSLILKVFL